MKKLLSIVLSLMVVGMSVPVSGCNVSQFVTYLNEVGPAVGVILNIISIADGKPFNSSVQAKINADVTAASTLFKDVSKSVNPDATVVANLLASLNALQNDVSSLNTLLAYKDPATQNEVTGLIGAAIDLVQMAETFVPQPVAVTPSTTGAATLSFKVQSKPNLSPQDLVKRVDALLSTKTGNAKVDAYTHKTRLHYHSKFVRMVSLGKAI